MVIQILGELTMVLERTKIIVLQKLLVLEDSIQIVDLFGLMSQVEFLFLNNLKMN